jgi:hypothetical protein
MVKGIAQVKTMYYLCPIINPQKNSAMKKFEYTTEMADKMRSAARRAAAIVNKVPVYKNKSHKDKKNDYNRRESKRAAIEED